MKQVIDAFNAAWNEHDLDAALALCTADVVFESTDPAPDGVRYAGRDAVRACWEPVFASHGHFDFEEISIFGESNERVVQRWRFDWGDGHVRGIDLITLRGELICEKLSYVKG